MEKPKGQTTIDFHTAITIPWSTVKSMVYYLRANLASHEVEAGSIKLPERVVPPRPKEPGEAADANRKIWDEEFGGK